MFSVFLLVLLFTATSAQLLTCTGTVAVTYNPPLKNTVQLETVTLSINFTSCEDLVNIRNGSSQTSLHVNKSCTNVHVGPPATFPITWMTSNGATEHSSIYFSYSDVVDGGGQTQVIYQNGTVSGTLGGYSAKMTLTDTSLNATACADGGIRTQTGTAVLVLTAI